MKHRIALLGMSVLLTAAGCSTTERNVTNAVGLAPEAPTLVIPTYNTKSVQVAAQFAAVDGFGESVALTDGSRWTVRDSDRRAAMVWRPESRVIVVESTDTLWPHTLINLDTHDASGLRVRREG